MKIADIAHVCHEANRALQVIQADPTISVSRGWDELDEETRQSAELGVTNILVNGSDPASSHQVWCNFKRDRGWVLGPVKDEVAKTHPLLVPYAELPDSAKVKDDLFAAVVIALGGLYASASTSRTRRQRPLA